MMNYRLKKVNGFWKIQQRFMLVFWIDLYRSYDPLRRSYQTRLFDYDEAKRKVAILVYQTTKNLPHKSRSNSTTVYLPLPETEPR